uniref:Uncharacterized protein n=1 Tax=Cacopsylla melanoneura TaxID=428564 RepID=A0A8D8W3W0_9HEMI
MSQTTLDVPSSGSHFLCSVSVFPNFSSLFQEVYASQIESLQKSTLDLQNGLENMKAQALAKYQEEYCRGFRTAQLKAAFEEDGFIQQLKLLRNMQTMLSPDHVDKLAASIRFKNNAV